MRILVCFALGAVVGTLLDGIHAYGDVLVYPDPAFGRWAWFVPLEFGLLGVAACLVCREVEPRVAATPLRTSPAARVLELALFAFLYFLTTLPDGGGWAVVLAIALIALAAGRVVLDGAPGDWIYVVAAALLGPAGEAALTAAGAFDYLEPDFAGIPIWLPGLWANGGFLIRRLVVPIALPVEASVPSAAPGVSAIPALPQKAADRS